MARYYAVYLSTAVLAIAHSPIWNAFHLVDIVTYVEHLRLIMFVADKYKLRLLATIALGLIAVYSYAVLVFVFFHKDVVLNVDDDLVFGCDNLWDCVSKALDLGFRNAPVFTSGATPIATPIFDLTYFLLINTILVSIITGIIIDTFAEMRANKDRVDEEVRSRCFICRIDHEKFNKFKGHKGYAHHIRVEHNQWAYVYLKHYILEKSKTDPQGMSGVELYLSRIISDGDGHFWKIVPNKRTMFLPESYYLAGYGGADLADNDRDDSNSSQSSE
eukprot:CAMPEP_0197519734 /NCGR_PEP_ID=MMETSP1318-20131121/5006_1 /TAXON_ID=552666 /ORGANISM="Partenskyella glossopodia, Strain RCC365" /LENGTH=273 /DNA_ID=CAMNT_0043070887 /DNA_START=124 /DNA_END=945 /DNA_ORIENTATION=-